MKIAVAAESQGANANVSMSAARAPVYLVFDDHGTLVDSIRNPCTSVDRGAARKLLPLLNENGINKIVAGKFGDTFMALLQANNIEAILGNGEAAKIIETVTMRETDV